jgi:putative restriction endonuclease
LAEDIENVLLLDWTHHMAFDAGLWTFDESGRLWIKPGFETESEK